MFGLVPFERNELWNPFREFENEFFKGFGSVSTAVQISKMRVTNSCWNAKCPVSIRKIFRSTSTAVR